MKTKRAVGGGPEAELSGEEEYDGVCVVEQSLVGEKSAPNSEVSMCALLGGAKIRPGKLVPRTNPLLSPIPLSRPIPSLPHG
jgi:hypothetical protein